MLLTLCVGGGALNTGNNLLFLMLGLMISTILASGIASEAVLRHLQLTRRSPQRLHAGEAALGAFLITNPRGYPSLSLEAIERRAHCTQGPQPQERVGGKDVPWWKFWQPDRFGDAHYVAIARVPQLPPHQTTVAQASYTFPHRGRYHSYGLRLATRFPFGLFHKVSDVEDPTDFLVYPALRPAPRWIAEIAANFGDAPRHRAGFGQEYFGLRSWRLGEDKRDISWKRSAKRDHFVVREHEEEERRALELVVVNTRPGGGGGEEERETAQRFEWGISQTTALLEALEAAGYVVGLRTLDGAVEPGAGRVHLDRMLGHLALIELHSRGGMGGTLPRPTRPLPPRPGGALGQAARVGLGFREDVAQVGEDFDLTLEFDHLEPQEQA